MIFKDNAIIKNIARFMKVKSKSENDPELEPAIDEILNKIKKIHGHRYSNDSLRNILSEKGASERPDKIYKFRLANALGLDNPEDLDAPDDFIKIEVVISTSNLPDIKKLMIRQILKINNPKRLELIFNFINGEYNNERFEFEAAMKKKIKEYEGLPRPKKDRTEDANNSKEGKN